MPAEAAPAPRKATFWPIAAEEADAAPHADTPHHAIVSAMTPEAAPARVDFSIAAEDKTVTPEKPAPESTALDPSQPKKSGWWKRAASSFGG